MQITSAAAASAQNQPVLGEDTVKVSDHVWAIMGWPNIGIVVGANATLVVDTGLGPRNGATVAASGRAEPAQAPAQAPLSPTGEAYIEEPSEEE